MLSIILRPPVRVFDATATKGRVSARLCRSGFERAALSNLAARLCDDLAHRTWRTRPCWRTTAVRHRRQGYLRNVNQGWQAVSIGYAAGAVAAIDCFEDGRITPQARRTTLANPFEVDHERAPRARTQGARQQ